MSEHEPNFHLEYPGGEFEATRQNAVLFRFMGALAMYDHAFFIRNEEEGRGFYLFSVNPAFPVVAQHMTENGFERHLDLRQVAQCDVDAYDQMIAEEAQRDLDGGIPDEWLRP